MRHDLLRSGDHNALRDLCVRYGVVELSLFGSFARGDAEGGSDVDLLVTFAPDRAVGFLTLARLQHELESLFGRAVDLVPKRGLKALIRDEVLPQAHVLYAA